ncbi:hypothetical protein [Haloechinothrix salitolerans]|uniref:hypothetical protein n=1 Tax=Haloechinothrix salitolerans TaxID=926830 RepID=UPI0031F185F7
MRDLAGYAEPACIDVDAVCRIRPSVSQNVRIFGAVQQPELHALPIGFGHFVGASSALDVSDVLRCVGGTPGLCYRSARVPHRAECPEC